MALDPDPDSPQVAAFLAADPGAELTGAPADPADPAAELVDSAADDAPAAADIPPAAAAEAAPPAPADLGEGDGQAAAAAPVLVEPGRVYAYSKHDDYATPPRVRSQLVLVVRVEGDGQVAGVPIGYADELGHFPAGELGPLDALDG